MKNTLILLLPLLYIMSCTSEQKQEYVVTSDIEHFWQAFDQITASGDSIEQLKLLDELYFKKGSPGLKAMMEVKRYTPQDYLYAINQYTSFWPSIRKNTLQAGQSALAIEKEIEQLKRIYPTLKPAKIYFTIGCLLSNGTTSDGLVLIGAEVAMADSTVSTENLPGQLGTNLSAYFKTNPIDDVVLLNVHEYVHTQQSDNGYDLLSQSLYEGVAEFVSVTATGKASVTPGIAYGKANEQKVMDRFRREMFSPHWNDWLYNNFENEFEMRDLGYFAGYTIAEHFYAKASDKKAAIKTLIELDFQSQSAIETFVDTTQYFKTPLATLKTNYLNDRPWVLGIQPFENGDQAVDPSIKRIKIYFSEEMNQRFRNQRIGPLGSEHVLPIRSMDFSDEGKAIVIGVALEPGKQYQLELTDQYRNLNGAVLKPFLIDFKTSGN